jgi:transcriptional regulator with XRE-family HTH domain
MRKIHRRPRTKPRYSIHFLKAWRQRQNMSRKELAKATGLAPQTVGRIENRLIQLTQETIDAFARALQISRGAFFRPPPSSKNPVHSSRH